MTRPSALSAEGETPLAIGEPVRVTLPGHYHGAVGAVIEDDGGPDAAIPYRVATARGCEWFRRGELERIDAEGETPRTWREGDAVEIRPLGPCSTWRAARITKIDLGARFEVRGKYNWNGSTWEVERVSDLDDAAVFRRPETTEAPAPDAPPAEPETVEALNHVCTRVHPATWRAEWKFRTTITVRHHAPIGRCPEAWSIALYLEGTCLASAEGPSIDAAESTVLLRLAFVGDAVRQLGEHAEGGR